MAYEVLTAFFLEAGFLGVMLFGMNRVGKGLHFTATLMVAIGTAISAFWIIVVNSWMHTPQGLCASTPQGQFVPLDWMDRDIQPVDAVSPRPHCAGGLSDDRSRRRRGRGVAPAEGAPRAGPPHRGGPKVMFSMAMWMAALVAPMQIFAGDEHGLNTLKYQPAKVAAMEGNYRPTRTARR